MKIAVLGATGSLGRIVVQKLVEEGHEVVAYVRGRADVLPTSEQVHTVVGALDDTATLTGALVGCDAVVSTLGPAFRMGSRAPVTFMQEVLPAITAAATSAGVSHLVLTSAFGVGDTREKASIPARLVYRFFTAPLFEDKARAEANLIAGELTVTTVYPVNLKAGASRGAAAIRRLDEVASVPGLPTLPFTDAAAAIAAIATKPTWRGQRVLVTTATGWSPAR